MSKNLQTRVSKLKVKILKSNLTKSISSHSKNIKKKRYINELQILLSKKMGKTGYKFAEDLSQYPRYLRVNDTYTRVYHLNDLPEFDIYPNIISKLLYSPFYMDLCIHIKPNSNRSMIKAARNFRSSLESTQINRIQKGKTRKEEVDHSIEQVSEFINNLVYGSEKAFQVSTYMSLSSKSLYDLINKNDTFKNISEEIGMNFRTHTFAQLQAFKSILPLNTDYAKKPQIIQTTLLSYLLPFLTKELNDPDGIFIGRNTHTGTFLIYDPFKAANANINIFGTSGSGKSTTAKILASRLWLRKIQTIVIDPEGEYKNLAKNYAGTHISFTKNYGLNPFNISLINKATRQEYISVLKTFFKFFISDKNYEDSDLDQALTKLLNQKNLCYDEFFKKLKNKTIVEDLKILTTGSLSGVFNSDTHINLDEDLIVYDLSLLESEIQKKPAIFLLSSLIFQQIKDKKRKRMLFIDEAHTLLEKNETAVFYKNLVKRARKYQLGVVSITQNLEDFFYNNKIGIGIITNAESNLLLKQSPASIPIIKDALNITDSETEILPLLDLGELILLRGNEHYFLSITPLSYEREIVT